MQQTHKRQFSNLMWATNSPSSTRPVDERNYACNTLRRSPVKTFIFCHFVEVYIVQLVHGKRWHLWGFSTIQQSSLAGCVHRILKIVIKLNFFHCTEKRISHSYRIKRENSSSSSQFILNDNLMQKYSSVESWKWNKKLCRMLGTSAESDSVTRRTLKERSTRSDIIFKASTQHFSVFCAKKSSVSALFLWPHRLLPHPVAVRLFLWF